MKPNVLEDLEEVMLNPDHPKRLVKIGLRMDTYIISELIIFLKQHQHTFAWAINDMIGISPKVIIHKLEVNPDYPLVKPNRKKFAPELNKIINEEVKKLKRNSFIREVHYLD